MMEKQICDNCNHFEKSKDEDALGKCKKKSDKNGQWYINRQAPTCEDYGEAAGLRVESRFELLIL